MDMTDAINVCTSTQTHNLGLTEWNATSTSYPRDCCIHELFEAQVDRRPEALALVFGDEKLSFGELDFRANQLARYLVARNIGSGKLVGISMFRCPNMVIAILGILKAGATYVPIDPTYPEARLAAMLEDVDLDLLLTTQEVVRGLPAHDVEDFCLDSDWEKISLERGDRLEGRAEPEGLAYVIFTSGSTGRAKAAAVFHRGWTNLMHWFTHAFGITEYDKVLVVSSFSFDITQRSIVMPLIVGGELHLFPSIHYDPTLLREIIEKSQISILNCSPSTFYPVVEGIEQASLQGIWTLRRLFLGGEPISAGRLKAWVDSNVCQTEVINVYGAAECSDVSSFYKLRDYERYIKDSVPIGRPIYNTQIYLVDEELSPVSMGEVGEIVIAGDGVGSGYINDYELTKDKFVDNAFSIAPNLRVYRTGDLGRLSADGNLLFVGRVDHQVKLRGFRIELGEIESVLRQDARVSEVIVAKKSFGINDDRLVAFVVLRNCTFSGCKNLHEEFRTLLRERLPDYMVPSNICFLPQMPISPNGKIDRNALMQIELLTENQSAIVLPRNEVEEFVAGIFAQVLKVDKVGVNDNFFDLGGYSFLLTEALSLIHDVYPSEISIFDFLKAPTVAAVAERIQTIDQAL